MPDDLFVKGEQTESKTNPAKDPGNGQEDDGVDAEDSISKPPWSDNSDSDNEIDIYM